MDNTKLPSRFERFLFRGDLPDFSMVVAREHEFAALERALVLDRLSVAAIVGASGTGKTTLAFMFSRVRRESFNDVISYLPLDPFRSLQGRLVAEAKNMKRRGLIIVEETDAVPPKVLREELTAAKRANPNVQYLLTSLGGLPRDVADAVVTLDNFSYNEFEDLLRRRLGGLPPEQAQEIFARLQGHPLASAVAAGSIRDGLLTAEDLLRDLDNVQVESLVGLDGRPLRRGSPEFTSVITDVADVSDELLLKLQEDPSLLYKVPPRKFEEIVAELLHRQGYEVNLTPISRDGGKDIYVAAKDTLGSFLYLVECKRYAPDRPVGIGIVQRLYGVVEGERATAGIVATTSHFTKDAVEFQQRVSYRLSLQDYLGVQQWLRKGTPFRQHGQRA